MKCSESFRIENTTHFIPMHLTQANYLVVGFFSSSFQFLARHCYFMESWKITVSQTQIIIPIQCTTRNPMKIFSFHKTQQYPAWEMACCYHFGGAISFFSSFPLQKILHQFLVNTISVLFCCAAWGNTLLGAGSSWYLFYASGSFPAASNNIKDHHGLWCDQLLQQTAVIYRKVSSAEALTPASTPLCFPSLSVCASILQHPV